MIANAANHQDDLSSSSSCCEQVVVPAVNAHHDEEWLETIHGTQHMPLSVFHHEILSKNDIIGLEAIKLVGWRELCGQRLTCKQLPKITVWTRAITRRRDLGANIHFSLQYVG